MRKDRNLEGIHVLANSIRRTYNRLRHVTDEIHAETGLSAPKRTLLMDLDRLGAQTVPALASYRYVSRQIIQTQVNELSKEGFLEPKSNPEHKRSSLIALTKKGHALVDSMLKSENAFIQSLATLPNEHELASCSEVLDGIYEQLK